MDCSQPGSFHLWDFPGKNTGNPSQGDLLKPGTEIASPALAGELSLNHQGSQTVGTGDKKTCFCLGFLDNSIGKESACSAEDPGSIPGSGRFPE